VSLSPIFVAPAAAITLESIVGFDGFAWLIAAWLASALPIYLISLRLERWRSPIEAHSRAMARTMAVIALHVLIPMIAQIIAVLIGVMMIR